MKNKDLKRRIIEISYKNKLSHIASCLTACDIIEEIYSVKKPDEKFVLSAGHAHLAHLVVMEAHYSLPLQTVENESERLLHNYGIHCDHQAGCDVSTGSLGQGLPIALGMALADRSKNVYCLISDGECSEGSIWEALRIQKEQHLENLHVYVNINGWGAYKDINQMQLSNQLKYMSWAKPVHTNIDQFPFLKGQVGHYKVMNESDYKQAMEVLK